MAGKTILIVDDEVELRENLQDLLEFKGFNVLAYPNAEDALAEFDSLQPDAALLDIQLPGIDGLELLQRIRKKRPDLPVAMVSASSVRGVLAQAEEYGANLTIVKPYSSQEMLNAIEQLLA